MIPALRLRLGYARTSVNFTFSGNARRLALLLPNDSALFRRSASGA